MHYYSRNIGDYARDTGHLSALEHGVYMLLLDWYYLNERPITTKEAIRVSRGNPDETMMVLSEFFKACDAGWLHSYAEREIAAYRAKSAANRENGKKGGRPRLHEHVVDSIEPKTQLVSEVKPKETLTINHKPLTKNQKIKSTVRQAARFAEFWAVYPNKKGKQDAEKRWARDGLDSMADQIIGHVLLMQAQDDGWRRGYVPMGSTYLNQARWTDVPQAAPTERSAPVSKTMQALINLGGSNAVDERGNRTGVPAATLPWPGASASLGHFGRNGSGLDDRHHAQPGMGSGLGRPTLLGSLSDDDGFPD